MASFLASLMTGNFKEIWCEFKMSIPRALQLVGIYCVIKKSWIYGRSRFATASSADDNRQDHNQQIVESLQKMNEDFLSVQEGMKLLLDARQSGVQTSANQEYVTTSQIQALIKDHSRKLGVEVREICGSHVQQLKALHTENLEDDVKGKEEAELMQTEIRQLKETAELVQTDVKEIKKAADSMQAEIRPLTETTELLQISILPLKEAADLVQAELSQLKERAEIAQNDIRPLKEATEPIKTDIKQLKETTGPLQREIRQLKKTTAPIQREIRLLKEATEPMQTEIMNLKEAKGPMELEIKLLKEATEPTQTEIKRLKEEADTMQKTLRPLKKATEVMQTELKPLREGAESTKGDIKHIKEIVRLVQNDIRQLKETTKQIKNEMKPIKEVAGLVQSDIKPLKEMAELVKTEMSQLQEVMLKYKSSIIDAQVKATKQVEAKFKEAHASLVNQYSELSGTSEVHWEEARAELRDLELNTLSRFKEFEINTACKFDSELTILEHQREDDGGNDVGPTILLWKISGFRKKLRQLIEQKKCITCEELYGIAEGLKVKPVLQRGTESGKIYIQLEFDDDPSTMGETSPVPFRHYRRFELLDQSGSTERENIHVVDRPRFGMCTTEDTRLPYFCDSHLCTTGDLQGDSKYVRNNQVLIKVILEPLDFVCRRLGFGDGQLMWKICNYSKRKQSDLEDRRQRLTSEPFRTSEMGYNLQIELFLNQSGDDGLYLCPRLRFILGQNDETLFCPIAGMWEFYLLRQSENETKHHIFKEEEYGIETLLASPTSRRFGDLQLHQFVSQSEADDSDYCKDDTILVKAVVKVY